jgi:hypothetical protein
MNSSRQDGGKARHQPAIVAIEGATRRRQRDRSPGAAAAADRADQHVALDRRTGVADVEKEGSAEI